MKPKKMISVSEKQKSIVTDDNDASPEPSIVSVSKIYDEGKSSEDLLSRGMNGSTSSSNNDTTNEKVVVSRKRRLSKKERKLLKKCKKESQDGKLTKIHEQNHHEENHHQRKHQAKETNKLNLTVVPEHVPVNVQKEEDISQKKEKEQKVTSDTKSKNRSQDTLSSSSSSSISILNQQTSEQSSTSVLLDANRWYASSHIPIGLPQMTSSEGTLHYEDHKNNRNIESTISSRNGTNNKSTTRTTTNKSTLGKWFPNAILIKTAISYTNTGLQLTSNHTETATDIPSFTDGTISTNSITGTTRSPKSSLLLFYQYASPSWSKEKLNHLITYLSIIVRQRNLGGRIRVAQEGINATISAVDLSKTNTTISSTHTTCDSTSMSSLTSAKEALHHFALDLQYFDKQNFSNTDFKYIHDLPPDRHFKECKILPVKELVFYGFSQQDAPLNKGGIHLDAHQYHQMLSQDNTVVIDVRNHYETILGRFDGQKQQQLEQQQAQAQAQAQAQSEQHSKPIQQHENKTKILHHNKDKYSTGGAQYIDPLMRKSTDFPSWLQKDETKEKLRGKKVLMYCTGGVRCERASAYLKHQMGDDVDGVYQLKGGIERYLQAFPDGGFWRGKNFVFDKREAVSVNNINGDGGVLTKKARNKNKKNKADFSKSTSSHNNIDTSSKCCVCGASWDRYVGKKKCYTCGVPVLMCDSCMSKKPDKTKGMELSVRCPLCITENVTVPAQEVEWTNNGIQGKIENQVMNNTCTKTKKSNDTITKEKNRSKSYEENESLRQIQGLNTERKAANSVLKWGGGHASKKKDTRKMKRRLCQFGSECIRKDCLFLHTHTNQ